jgi:hypothetical protein
MFTTTFGREAQHEPRVGQPVVGERRENHRFPGFWRVAAESEQTRPVSPKTLRTAGPSVLPPRTGTTPVYPRNPVKRRALTNSCSEPF